MRSIALLLLMATTAAAQRPLAPIPESGDVVYPVYEGWYKNPDGTFSLSFGYFNRNSEEALDIPIGPNNFISPGAQNQNQPTHFEPRRHWGVFAVTVPANFGTRSVTWTVKIRGQTIAIPASLREEWEIDAVQGEVGSGNTPPVLTFPNRPDGRGPAGATGEPLKGKAGTPITVTVNAKDDGRAPASTVARGTAQTTTLTWFVHQGPANAKFAPTTARVPVAGGSASTAVTFSLPGEYVLRVRANDASGVASGGHAQCCWTNGFVKVIVTP
jgi:hypothetical protein